MHAALEVPNWSLQGCQVTELHTLEELASVRKEWHRLLSVTPSANYFQTLEWLETYWAHYGEGQRLRVLLVERDGELVGILPLVIRRETTKVGPVRFLTYPLDHWGSFYGPIGADPAVTLAAGLRHLQRHRRDWQVLELRWVEAGGQEDGPTQMALARAGFSYTAHVTERSYLVDMAGATFDEYWAGRTSKFRNNYKRWERRLAEMGPVTLRRYRPNATSGAGELHWDLYDLCEELARRSWQGSSCDGTTLSSDKIRPFLRDVHATAARSGHVDMNLLYAGETPIAYAYNYVFQGYVYGLRIGYDAEASRQGVGNLLYVRAIQDSFARGDRTYDFGIGSYEAKRYLFTRAAPVSCFSHYRTLDLQSQLIRLKRWSEQRKEAWRRDTRRGDAPRATGQPDGATAENP